MPQRANIPLCLHWTPPSIRTKSREEKPALAKLPTRVSDTLLKGLAQLCCALQPVPVKAICCIRRSQYNYTLFQQKKFLLMSQGLTQALYRHQILCLGSCPTHPDRSHIAVPGTFLFQQCQLCMGSSSCHLRTAASHNLIANPSIAPSKLGLLSLPTPNTTI